jgi:hypothetical protein
VRPDGPMISNTFGCASQRALQEINLAMSSEDLCTGMRVLRAQMKPVAFAIWFLPNHERAAQSYVGSLLPSTSLRVPARAAVYELLNSWRRIGSCCHCR